MTMDLSPIIISLKTATLSIIITFFLGVAAAQFVFRLKSKTMKTILDGLFTLPLVLPPTVAGFFLLYIFGMRRPIGKFLIEYFAVKIAFSWGATVLAAVVISFPLMYRSARGAFEQVNPDVLSAGRTLGMSEWNIFWKVQMPIAWPGVISGAVLAFARGLGEFGATAMIAGNIRGKTRTLPLAVYSAVASGKMDDAGQYVVILVGISFIVVVCMNQFFNPFIKLWLGSDYCFSQKTVLIISIMFLLPGLNNVINIYKDSCGLFWETRYRALATAIVNLVVSIVLVKKIGLEGVFIGTIVAYLTTIYMVDPRVVFHKIFEKSIISYYVSLIKTIVIYIITAVLVKYLCSVISVTGWIGLILQGIAAVILINIFFIIIFGRLDEFKYYKNLLLRGLKR